MGERAADHADEEVDEGFTRLLDGLRTTLPGAQVLLGFLLVLPFQAEFASLTTVERGLYDVAFFSSALASVLLIAPSVQQRIRAPISGIKRSSKRHVDVAVRVSLVGTVLLGVALTASTALIGSVVAERWTAILGAAVVGLAVAWTWAYQPLVQFHDG